MGASCPANRSSEPDKVEVKREGLPLRNERGDPWMRLPRVHPLRNESEPFPDPEDMGIDRKGFPPQPEQKETMSGFGANPLETPDGLLDLLRIQFFQKRKAQLTVASLDPSQDLADAHGLLIGQPGRPNGLCHCLRSCIEKVFPPGESDSQALEGSIPVQVVGVLGENGLDQGVEGIPSFSV